MIAPLCVVFMHCILTVTIETKEVGDDFAIRESDQEWLNSLFYVPTEPRVRKEYRMLSDDERFQFNDAFVKMKKDRSVIPNKYDLFCSVHARRTTRNSAHRGTGFLGWHRVYTLLMENAMREWYPNITMAYWDTTLDAVLELPRESSLWSEDFMGNGDGYVQKGVFKGWGVQTGELYRTVGALYGPLAEKNISFLLEHDHIGNISYPLKGKNVENVFEEIHNRVHHFVGGEMKVIETAADDPVFFPYHSFVSYIWEEFRALQRLKGIDPETDWDEHYGPARHHKYSPMGLGNLLAIDGSSELFTENIIFADRPSCSREVPDCGTPHLYCNITVEKCCPWTVREYNILKTAGQDNQIPLTEAVIPFIKSKVNKGFLQLSKRTGGTSLEEYGDPLPEGEDLFIIMEEKYGKPASDVDTDINNGDNSIGNYLDLLDDHALFQSDGDDDHFHGDHEHDSDDHSHDGDEHSHDGDEHSHDGDEHSHDGHTHSRGQVIQGGKQIHFVVSWMEDIFPLYFVFVVLAALTGLRLVLTVVTKCIAENRSAKSRKYRMDGIVNSNFSDDENKKNQSNTQGNRRDNIYTVTVTTSSQHLPEHNGTFVRFEKYSKENMVNNAGRATSTERQSSTASDYLDMTYASHTSKESIGELTKHPDMFEHEAAADCETDEIDRSYNSIENENFDITCKAVIETEGRMSEDSFDEFDTYDNIMFEREAVAAENETVNTGSEGFYGNYLQGTRL